MFRQIVLRFSMLVPLIGGLVVLAYSAIPSSTAFACLPCNCHTLRSVNCFGPYALYTPTDSEGNCSIDIWAIENGRGKRAILQTAADLAKLPETADKNLLIEDAYNGFISLYKLTSGEYQINVGPNVEGKVYVIDFTGCPADNVYESNYIAGQ